MARNPLAPFRSGSFIGGDPFFSLHREMNRLFDDAFRGATLPSAGTQDQSGRTLGNFVNAHMNVSETDSEIRITAELPGVTEQEIDVSLDDDMLTIRGEKKFEQAKGGEKESFHFVERSYGTFQRSLRLPYPVKPEEVQAHFESGVLTVTLPKNARQERSRRIQVQTATGSQSGGEESARTGGGDVQTIQASQGGGSSATSDGASA